MQTLYEIWKKWANWQCREKIDDDIWMVCTIDPNNWNQEWIKHICIKAIGRKEIIKKKTECWWKFCGLNKDVAKRQKMRIINKMQHPRPINGKEMKNIHFISIFSTGIHFSRSGARFSFHRLNVYSTKISSSVCLSLTPSTADTRIHLAVTGKVNETVISIRHNVGTTFFITLRSTMGSC